MKTIILAVILMLASRAEALLFNVTYDASVANAPTSFIPAFTNAINFYQNSFTDPITISLAVGWGEVSGFPILPGVLGASATFLQDDYSYNDVRRALIADAKSIAD